MKRFGTISFSTTLFLLTLLLNGCLVERDRTLQIGTSSAKVSKESASCLECHTRLTAGIVETWDGAVHSGQGVGCYECHGAYEDDPDAMKHHGFIIAVLVTPADCGECHGLQAGEFLASHHAQAGQILGSLDNYLGDIVEGMPASINGCQSCHGSFVEVRGNGEPTPQTYPNFGIGRVNPDGTNGSCAACHSRHNIVKAQVRDPETCAKCHIGPDHPQIEIYESSRHGMLYENYRDDMNLTSDSWIPGKDYFHAPTCATCHISASQNTTVTHDVGSRLSWKLGDIISGKTEFSDIKRSEMQDVCYSCHSPDYVERHYTQYDAGMVQYNEKFAIPAKEVIDELRADGLIDETPFNERIEWVDYYLGHHEGRRAKNGYAMFSPLYVQWHGMFEVAERFYFELKEEAERLKPGIMDEIMSRPEHRWFYGDLDNETRKEVTSNEAKYYE